MPGDPAGETTVTGRGGPGGSRERWTRVLLVGFMASGKTTVGRLVARELGWRFADADAEVERRTGSTIPEIFARRGEAWFRRWEAEVVDDLLDLSECVVVPGGGWASSGPERLEGLPSGTLSVWLQVPPEEAVGRAAESGAGRPLLDGTDDPVAEARRLLAEREPHYGRTHLHLDTVGAEPVEIADLIIRAVRRGDPAADR